MKQFAGPGKKILIVSGMRIFPPNTGGHVRTSGFARSLARMGHQVTVYSLAGRQEDYALGGSRKESFIISPIETNLTEETNLGLGFGLTQTVMRRAGLPRYWQHALLRNGIVPSRLKSALLAADITISDFPWCPRIPGPWSSKPWFMLSHNLEYRLLEQADSRNRRFASWMRRVESAAPAQYTDIFACADEDQDFFRRQEGGARLQLPMIRCGVDPGAYQVASGTRERVRRELGLTDADTLLVFSGSRFAPNVEALQELQNFCRAEAAFLATERVHLLVLGSLMPEPLREGALIATGRVPEVAPYFAAADAGLNPVTRGSGANIKLFEYLAARLPVISTVFGVRGTTLEPGIDFSPYTPREFKAAIENFVRGQTRAEWRTRAQSVWERHSAECDIEQMVRDAVLRRPEFAVA